MHTQSSSEFDNVPEALEAQDILRRCVHCGFCNASCPTYQLMGDELDGPRGRIYLIKQWLEGERMSEKSRLHLDRCLTCRSCESACPSGVEYGRLVDIGRRLSEQKINRTTAEYLLRKALLSFLPYPERTSKIFRAAQWFRPLFPERIKRKIPEFQPEIDWASSRHPRKVLLLEGCVQGCLQPSIDASAARVLDQLGISAIRIPSGCCGALHYHNGDQKGGLEFMRRTLDACWPHIESGVEAIIITASGCGVMLKEYGKLFCNNPGYAEKAECFSGLCKDIAEVLVNEDLSNFPITPAKIAFQSPCSLQHGQKLGGVVETILTRLGFVLVPVSDSHLCCGSAGAYSILQPKIAQQLRERKLTCLAQHQPELIATANIGCLLHLQEKTDIPVRHWIQLLA